MATTEQLAHPARNGDAPEPCPTWCDSDHGADAPPNLRQYYTAHMTMTGLAGSPVGVSAIADGETDKRVRLSIVKAGMESELHLSAKEARMLAMMLDDIASMRGGAAKMTEALRVAASLLDGPGGTVTPGTAD